MNVIKNGNQTQVTFVEIADSLKNVLPDWAIPEVLNHMVSIKVEGGANAVIDLTKICNPDTTPYKVIDLQDARTICSEQIKFKDDRTSEITVIENNLIGFLTSKQTAETTGFLVFSE